MALKFKKYKKTDKCGMKTHIHTKNMKKLLKEIVKIL